jgi:heat shock protein HslJ
MVASQQREPHIILNPESRRVGGSGGCNRLVGSYELHDNKLTFNQMAGTMMACPEGSDSEQAFLEALRQVHSWKITGQHLALFDATGTLVARFEARAIQ